MPFPTRGFRSDRVMKLGLPEKIVELHLALHAADIPHAFGGALALAWCTQRARGTIDIDLNLFASTDEAAEIFNVLPAAVSRTKKDLSVIRKEGQVRLWWDNTPIDLFLNTTEIHEPMAGRCRWERFADQSIPFLSCYDLAVLKVFFNRTKDWADLEEMHKAGTLDVSAVTGVIVTYLGQDDERVAKLAALATA